MGDDKAESRFGPDLVRGSLDLMLLSVLAEGPKYGYLLQQRLKEASRSMVDMKAGTLYPLLHKLEDEKLIRSRWEEVGGRRRKWYELTARGQKRLGQQAQQWRLYAETVGRLLADAGFPPTNEAWPPAEPA